MQRFYVPVQYNLHSDTPCHAAGRLQPFHVFSFLVPCLVTKESQPGLETQIDIAPFIARRKQYKLGVFFHFEIILPILTIPSFELSHA